MDLQNAGPAGHATLADRVKAMLLKPKEEWPRIEAEATSEADILKRYVLPLAAIGPVAGFIASQLFGRSFLFVTTRPSFAASLGTAVFSYVLSIVAVFVLALIANWLAPKFNGQANRTNALNLVAYGATAAWVAQIFSLVPMLSFFSILGLYSIYIIYTGVIPMMKVAEDSALGYTAVTFLCAFVLQMLVGLIAGAAIGLVGLGSVATMADRSESEEVEVTIPGVGTINTGKMEEAAKRMEKVQKGEIKAVPTDTLKALLPETIGDFTRTGVSTQAMGTAGAGVEGSYSSGEYSFDLQVNDMLALSGIAGITGAIGIEQTREDETGYERVGTVDGQWRSEKWNSQSASGSYGVMIADRFQVEASGTVPSMDVLKKAVAAIDEGDLEDLAQ